MLRSSRVLRSCLVAAACASLVLLWDKGTHRALAQITVPESEVRLLEPRGLSVVGRGTSVTILVASRANSCIVLLKSRTIPPFEEDETLSSLEPLGVIQGRKGGPLSNPRDVAVDSRGRIVVADAGNDAVKIYQYDSLFEPRRYSVETMGGRLGSLFSSPEGVAVDERDNIVVFDTGNAKVQILSPEGKTLAVLSGDAGAQPPDLRSPGEKVQRFLGAPVAGCCLGNGYLAVADMDLPTYSIWRYDPASPRTETCEFVGYGPPREEALNFYIRDMAYNRERGFLAYVGSNFPLRNAAFLYLRMLNPDDPREAVRDEGVSSVRIPLMGWLKNPAGVAFSPEGDLFITDAASDSVQKIGRESFGVLDTPVSVDAQRTIARLSYFSTCEVTTLFEYEAMPRFIEKEGALERAYSDPEKLIAHAVQLNDLLPGTRYGYRYFLSRESFRPPSEKDFPNFSRMMFFVTQGRSHTIQYVSFPMTVLLFTNEPVESARARLTQQLDAARLFFWVNSRMACNIKFKLEVAKGPVKLPPLKKGMGGLPSQEFDACLSSLDALVRQHTDSDLRLAGNVFIISPRSSPAVTCGLPYPGAAVSLLNDEADITWTFIKECQKHFSMMHLASGRDDTLPGLLKEPNCNRSQVLWDSRADFARAFSRQGWLSNPFGGLRTTADDDEDGFPDDEPDCPLDEKRFGTSVATKDTDGDGVSDLNEILASRWASGFTIEGTRVIKNHVAPSPSTPDSDGDGVEDSADNNPLCPLADSIPRLNVALDGKIGESEWAKAAAMTIADDEYRGALRAAWNGTHLCFALTRDGAGPSGNPPSIRVRVDGTANGFLRGLDNLTLLFEPKAGGTFTVRQEAEGEAFVPGGRPVGSPWSDMKNVAAAWTAAGDSAQVEIGLPKSPSLGLNLFLEEQTRFDVELRPAESSLWLRVFEPLALFRGVLTQPQPGGKTPD